MSLDATASISLVILSGAQRSGRTCFSSCRCGASKENRSFDYALRAPLRITHFASAKRVEAAWAF
jgi:hypothetical protein